MILFHLRSPMNSMPASQDEQQTEHQNEIVFEIVDRRWEKEIERDLMMQLQTWHADRAVAQDRESPDANADALLKVHSEHFLEPVYYPLAGNTEKALGDALAAASKLLLIECKLRIEVGEWAREAEPRREEPDLSNPGNPKIYNAGGKNRRAQLAVVSKELYEQSEPERARRIANSCHVLIASDPQHPHAGPNALHFTLYWDFVMGAGQELPKIDPQSITQLEEFGAEFEEFRVYALSLVAARNGTGTDTRRLEDQLIVLARRKNSWQGHRATDKQLEAALKAALILRKDPETSRRNRPT